MHVILIPAVFSTKQAHEYVGSKPLFEELLAHHGAILKPLRTTQRGDSFWRRTTIDATLAVAEQTGTLIHKAQTGDPLPIRRKTSRHFREDSQGLSSTG